MHRGGLFPVSLDFWSLFACSRELTGIIPLISFWWACCSGSGNSSILDRLLPSWADSPLAHSALSAIAPGMKMGSRGRRPAAVASGSPPSPPALLPPSCEIRFERDGGEDSMMSDGMASSANTLAHATAARTSAEDGTAGLPYKAAGEAAMQATSRGCGGEGSVIDQHLHVHASPREADRHAGQVWKHDSESVHRSGEHMVGRLHAAEPPVIAADEKGTAHVCKVQRTCTAMMRITPGCREERVCPGDDLIDRQSALLEIDTDDEEDDLESVLMHRMQWHEVESRMKRLERRRMSTHRRVRGLDATSRPSEECQQVAHRPRRTSTRPHSHASQSPFGAAAAAWVGHIDLPKGSSAERRASSDRPLKARPLSFCFTPTEGLDTDRNPIGLGRDVQRSEVERCVSRPCHDGLRAFSLTC
jgi:hypothetical protein